jgi:Arc/MetJ-type ribon-helix-helix transcriptional regulator
VRLLAAASMTYSTTMKKTAKIAISLERKTVEGVDRLVTRGSFPSRSRFIQEAVEEKLQRLDRTRLAAECAKLDPRFEQQLAEEGIVAEAKEWPEY